MEYNPTDFEAKWQKFWQEKNVYHADIDLSKPKCYVLDMFPYPSGAGLHVGHPLGYIASDIYSRYKVLKGFNVLHPMGFDSFGLPAEQYAIDTGQHPAITTENNIATYKSQLEKIGFSYDWKREVRTSDPKYYKWTQWIFAQLFDAWFDTKAQKARHISELINIVQENGNSSISAACDEDTPVISAQQWMEMSEKEQQLFLLKYRLTYVADSLVNWCPALGSVLANDEIKDGLSERGGHPVERKKMRQWMMRLTAYADRLLQGLESLEWSEALKEMQKNWIGKSFGALVHFPSSWDTNKVFTVFTTRPDTLYGVSFLSIAPETEGLHEWVPSSHREEVEAYVSWAKNRSERERQSEVKNVTGVFTGAFVQHPLTGKQIPIWIADYVLAGYGTGCVMGVPASDERDFRFAKHFQLEILPVIEGTNIEVEANTDKEGILMNSGPLNGLKVPEAIQKMIQILEEKNAGKGKVNFRLRDAVFSRQRYWGEPVPVYFKEDVPYFVGNENLPLLLPEIDEYKPTLEGEPPLGRANDWLHEGKHPYELTTMPGWAGSSWYFLRYMDPTNETSFVSKEAVDYWKEVDLYIGGSEHAVGHLLYSRFWTHFLYDLGFIGFNEPFKKLVNQGMIQGRSSLAYRVKNENVFVSADLKDAYETQELHIDVNIVENDCVDINALKAWRSEYADYTFICSEDGKFRCNYQVEKMSKRWYNVVNPDGVIEKYSADTLRLYEMFLGPLELSKPWDTSGIEGVSKFLRKIWRAFYEGQDQIVLTDEEPSLKAKKILHKTIKKVSEDIERLSFNTSVSAFMIAVNELQAEGCKSKSIWETFLIVLCPFAPHISEELWHALGNSTSVTKASFPSYDESLLVEDEIEYPVSVNGKVRAKILLSSTITEEQAKQAALAEENVLKFMEGKELKKFIFVPKRIINMVVG